MIELRDLITSLSKNEQLVFGANEQAIMVAATSPGKMASAMITRESLTMTKYDLIAEETERVLGKLRS